jgi:phosphoribosylpyrophosphate synthetase
MLIGNVIYLFLSAYIGESVKDKDVIIVDDMVETGKTLSNTTKILYNLGAANIYAFVTHNLLNQASFQKVENLPIVELVTTNTVTNVNICFIFRISHRVKLQQYRRLG